MLHGDRKEQLYERTLVPTAGTSPGGICLSLVFLQNGVNGAVVSRNNSHGGTRPAAAATVVKATNDAQSSTQQVRRKPRRSAGGPCKAEAHGPPSDSKRRV